MTLDFLGSVLLMAAIVVNVTAIVTTLAVSGTARLAVAAVIGLWIGLPVALHSSGSFQGELALAFPLVGLMATIPIAAVALGAWWSEAFRSALLGLPMPLLIGLNALRLFGFFFILLAAAGRLGGPFPQFAGWGDILVGALAVPLAMRAAQGQAGTLSIAGWNALGLIDLVVAVTLGTLSANGFVFQLLHFGEGSAAIQDLPWLLIPTVLVPFYLVAHGIIFAHLRAGQAGSGLSAART
jgi:hypothetical protein